MPNLFNQSKLVDCETNQMKRLHNLIKPKCADTFATPAFICYMGIYFTGFIIKFCIE